MSKKSQEMKNPVYLRRQYSLDLRDYSVRGAAWSYPSTWTLLYREIGPPSSSASHVGFRIARTKK